MKKRVLMSLVVLAIVGIGAVFAQQPTLDKLKFTGVNTYTVSPAFKSISGAVVIPSTYNDKPSTIISGFDDCTQITSVTILEGVTTIGNYAFRGSGLTSVTIPASINSIGDRVFQDCNNLTSVTFNGNTVRTISSTAFPGNLITLFKSGAGGAGTYTRQAGSDTWTKQGGFSLNGTWTRSDGMKITITENGQNITITGDKPNNGGKLNKTYAER